MMQSKHKISVISLTVVLIAAVALACGSCWAATKKKPVVSKSKAVKVPVISGPKVLAVVVGQPFESAPTSGPNKISVTMCAEETESATFTAKLGKNLSGVFVSALDDLVGPGRIPRQNIAVYKLDGENLIGLPLGANSVVTSQTDIGPTPTQFWIDITVPKDAKPGVYKGAIGFSYDGKILDRVPIDVTIRPLRLIGSSKQYALYTKFGPGCGGNAEMSADIYAQFLTGVAKLGFRAMSVASDSANVATALNAHGAAGLVGTTPMLTYAFSTNIPTEDQVTAIENAKKTSGVRSLLYFCTMNPMDEQQISTATDQVGIFHRAGVQAAATISDQNAAGVLLPVLEGVNYKVDMPYVQNLINGGNQRNNKWEYYWWDARESVNDNRIYAGIALWRSGLYGCMPTWMPDDGGAAAAGLNSLKCAALREGINDTRYITTYMKALRELKDKKREKDKDYIAATEQYLTAFMSKPLDQVKIADLRAFRAKMAEFSIKLSAML